MFDSVLYLLVLILEIIGFLISSITVTSVSGFLWWKTTEETTPYVGIGTAIMVLAWLIYILPVIWVWFFG